MPVKRTFHLIRLSFLENFMRKQKLSNAEADQFPFVMRECERLLTIGH